MNEMIERVARAIADADQEDYMEDYKRYDRRARAALKAMRDPTESMLQAGFGEKSPSAWTAAITPDDQLTIFQDMIDAALNDHASAPPDEMRGARTA